MLRHFHQADIYSGLLTGVFLKMDTLEGCGLELIHQLLIYKRERLEQCRCCLFTWPIIITKSME